MPLEIRRIYVRRTARSWAGLAVITGSFAAAIAAASSSARAALEVVIPGHAPAIASDLLFITPIAGLLAYFVARALAEERFTAAMLRTVRPRGDVFTDVDRLSITPAVAGRELATRFRAPSIAAAVAAMAIAAPLFLLVAAAFLKFGAWQRLSAIETVAWRAGAPLVQVAIASIVLGFAWLAIATKQDRLQLAARARRSAGVLGFASLALVGLGGVSTSEPRVFMWTWGSWALGAAVGLVWAASRVDREDALIHSAL